jgi:hypothetical protein
MNTDNILEQILEKPENKDIPYYWKEKLFSQFYSNGKAH